MVLNNTGDTAVEHPLVKLYVGTHVAPAGTDTCKDTGGVAQTRLAVTNGTLTCSGVTYDLVTDDITAKTVSLVAAVYAGATAVASISNSTAADVGLGHLSVQPTTMAVSGTAVTTLAPAAADEEVTTTFMFRNTGPIDVTNITVTAPNPAVVVTACDAIVATAATDATGTDKTCMATYTVLPEDLASATKTLTFGLAVADTYLATTWPTPDTIVVDIPLKTLTTSFTAADCAPVSTGTFWSVPGPAPPLQPDDL